MIKTSRLKMYPATQVQMEEYIALERVEELKAAYCEMLDGCLLHVDEWEWYALWFVELYDGTHVGDLNFKGLDSEGVTEIGYGILEEFQGQGYATEAVKAVVDWALDIQRVTIVEAETESNNKASQRVLEKCGFVANGKMGKEGPRFSLKR